MGNVSGPSGVEITRSLVMKNVAVVNWSRIETQIKEIKGLTSCKIGTNGHLTVKAPGNIDASALGTMIDAILAGRAEQPIGVNSKKGRKPSYNNRALR